MLRLIALLVVCIMMLGLKADTWTDPDTGVKWSYSISEGEASIIAAYGYDQEIEIPSTLGNNPVTSIADRAFMNEIYLARVTMPEGVRRIGVSAFYGCSCLSNVIIPSTVTNVCDRAFGECATFFDTVLNVCISDIRAWCEITMGDRVFGKSYRMYLNGEAVTDIDLPEGLRDVGVRSFEWCGLLKSVTIPVSVTNVGEYAFGYCRGLTNVVISSDSTMLERCAFYSCSNLERVALPSNITCIADYLYYGCRKVASVSIPKNVKSIGAYAFGNCDGLRSLGIPASVTNIDSLAFCECRNLSELYISDLARWCEFSLGETFGYSHALFLEDEEVADLVVPSGVMRIGAGAFCGCSGLTSVTIPSSVTNIGNSAFCFCEGLTNVTISSGVKSIGSLSFRRCNGLVHIRLPEGLEIMGSEAFSQCASLRHVEIPSTLKRIADYSFSSCGSMSNFKFHGDAPTVGDSAFKGAAQDCLAEVYNGTSGWDDDGDGMWCGLKLRYVSRPLSVLDDFDAVVTGDQESGFMIRPSVGREVVEIAIPDDIAAENVTVEVGPSVERVKPHGAKVKIVRDAYDVTSYLELPDADESGTIDLTQAVVKDVIVKEVLDMNNGACVSLNAESPILTTAETRPGLTYTLKEGISLFEMHSGDSKIGDGKSWTPTITVKGGTSGFYSIKVTR